MQNVITNKKLILLAVGIAAILLFILFNSFTNLGKIDDWQFTPSQFNFPQSEFWHFYLLTFGAIVLFLIPVLIFFQRLVLWIKHPDNQILKAKGIHRISLGLPTTIIAITAVIILAALYRGFYPEDEKLSLYLYILGGILAVAVISLIMLLVKGLYVWIKFRADHELRKRGRNKFLFAIYNAIIIFVVGVVPLALVSLSGVRMSYSGEEGELPILSNTAECSKSSIPIEQSITGTFRSIDDFTSAGEATLSGYVVTRNKKYFEYSGEEVVEKVYLEIVPQNGNTPQSNFYSYFIRMIEEGNTVNSREDNKLLFSLGELTDNGNIFSSTADISSLAEAKILSAIKTGEIISLRIQVPVWTGMGAPSNFSFACAIEFSKD